MARATSVPTSIPSTPAGIAAWARGAAGVINSISRRAEQSDPFFSQQSICISPPVNTTIASAVEIVFTSPYVGNGILILTGVGFEDGVRIAVNDVDLGSLSDPDLTSEILYEIAISNLINGFNTLKIWSSTSDTGELRAIEAWRNFSKETSEGSIWGKITGTGKPQDDAQVNPADLAELNAVEGAKFATIEAGADVTGTKTSLDATNLAGVPAATVVGDAQTGRDLTLSNGVVLHRSSIDDVDFNAGSGMTVTEGPNRRKPVTSLNKFPVRDGSTLTHVPVFAATPSVFIRSSGVTFDPNLDQVNNIFFIQRREINATAGGFTVSIRLVELLSGVQDPKSLDVDQPATGLTRDTLDKGSNDTGLTTTLDGVYTLKYNITVDPDADPEATGTVGFWENSTGAFIERACKSHTAFILSANFSDSIFFTLTGIDTFDNFRMVLTRTGSDGIVSIILPTPTVRWVEVNEASTSDVTATPDGVGDGIAFMIDNIDSGSTQ